MLTIGVVPALEATDDGIVLVGTAVVGWNVVLTIGVVPALVATDDGIVLVGTAVVG